MIKRSSLQNYRYKLCILFSVWCHPGTGPEGQSEHTQNVFFCCFFLNGSCCCYFWNRTCGRKIESILRWIGWYSSWTAVEPWLSGKSICFAYRSSQVQLPAPLADWSQEKDYTILINSKELIVPHTGEKRLPDTLD